MHKRPCRCTKRLDQQFFTQFTLFVLCISKTSSMVAPGKLGHCCSWLLVFSLICFVPSAAAYVGLNYGRNGDNLPSPSQAVSLLRNLGMSQVRIYDSDPTVLAAFQGSNIQLVIGLLNSELDDIGASYASASAWVASKILPYVNSTNIFAIGVGNEVLTGFTNASSLLVPAMNNIYNALTANNLQSIKVSSPCSMELLAQSYLPSSGKFSSNYSDIPVLLEFLTRTSSPYMVNVYPWKAYTAQRDAISLDYALFYPNAGVFDSGASYTYTNLFDAQVDAVYAALTKANHSDLVVVVSETGWPTAGDTGEAGASIQNAQTYNANLVKRVMSNTGTPARPGAMLNVFLYELYNENLNVGPASQRNFGLFNPDSTPVYAINFGGSNSGGNGYGYGRRSWCIAKQGISETALQISIDFACGMGNVNCTAIQPNGTCFLPDTRYSHASYAMNQVYVNSFNGTSACNFQGAARITTTDPSYGSCVYPASTISYSGSHMSTRRFSSAQQLYQLFFLLFAIICWAYTGAEL